MSLRTTPHRRLELGPVPVVVVADQQSQIAACDGFLDEFGAA